MFETTNRIGLTIDQSGIRYAKASAKKKSYELQEYGYLPFKEDFIHDDQIIDKIEIGERLVQWATEHKLTGKQVYLALPTSQVMIRRVAINTTNKKELQQLVELEIETTLHLPFQNPIYSFVTTDVDIENNTTNVIVYASPLKWVRDCIELLELANIKVKSIEMNAFSIARALREQGKAPTDDTMVVHLNQNYMEVYLYNSAQPVFIRRLEEYEQDNEEQGFSPRMLESINSELSRLFSFYQYSMHEGSRKIQQVVVIGDAKGIVELARMLQMTQPEVQVEQASVTQLAANHEVAATSIDDYAVAYGLALYDAKKQSSINLLPHREASVSSLSRNSLAAIILCIAVIAICVFLYVDTKQSVVAEQKALDGIVALNTALNEKLSASQNTTQQIVSPEETIALIQNNKQDIIHVLDELNSGSLQFKLLNHHVVYNYPGEIILETLFMNMKNSADYLNYLRHRDFVDDVYLNRIAVQSISDSTIFDLGYLYQSQYKLTWKGSSTGENVVVDGVGETNE